jgi:hypothetical protein
VIYPHINKPTFRLVKGKNALYMKKGALQGSKGKGKAI